MKSKIKVLYQLSPNLRYGNKQQKNALLKWRTQPKFRDRKPTPEELVRECKRKSSPLYGLIEVNRTKAARIYWRQAAQDILRHINVVRIDVKTSEVISRPVVAYVAIKREQYGRIPEKNYVPTRRVADNPSLRQSVLERAHADFLAWLRRYERYDEFMQEFSPVVAAYAGLRKTMEGAA